MNEGFNTVMKICGDQKINPGFIEFFIILAKLHISKYYMYKDCYIIMFK